jgi:hypothetical protein
MDNFTFYVIIIINVSDYILGTILMLQNYLCGLVVRVLGYRFGALGSIPGTTRKKK